MKNLLKSGLLVGLLSMTVSALDAQIIVNIRPSRPTVVVAKTPAPSPGYVWIDEEWSPKGNNYAWKGGYWSKPSKKGAKYNKGYWKQNKKGWHWVPGRWK
jgi:hypothetical protein